MSDEQKKSVNRAIEIESRKMQTWQALEKQTKTISQRSISRIMMRYAAILLPFLVIGLVWAGDIKAFFANFGHKNNTPESVSPANDNSSSKCDNLYIRFEAADLGNVTKTLMARYPEIKGLKNQVKDDTIKVTTIFDNQPLNDVLEELNIHFGHNFALDSDGYLVISD